MIFVFLSVITYSAQNVANKEMGRRYGNLKGVTLIQDLALVFWACIIMLCASSFKFPELKHLGFSALFGFLYILTMFLLLKAMQLGSIGESTIMINLGLFFSSLFGIIRYGDRVTILTGAGIICMLAVILLSLPSKKEKKENANKLKWFIYAIFSALCNGTLAVIKRIVAAWNSDGCIPVYPMTDFLFWAFAFSVVGCLIILLFKKTPKETVKTLYSRKNFLPVFLFGMIGGMGTACGNLFQMVAISNGISSAIVYPVCAGSLITIAWLISVIYYKEIKISVKSLISLILCLAGIVLTQF